MFRRMAWTSPHPVRLVVADLRLVKSSVRPTPKVVHQRFDNNVRRHPRPDHGSALCAAAAAALAFASASVSFCENTSSPPTKNPLWPSGVSNEMVNLYVEKVLLADPNINMRSVPDTMERVLYISTVRLTLNTIYETLATLHGIELLHHRLLLKRDKIVNNSDSLFGLLETRPIHESAKIDVQVLQALADELLRSQAVNQWWIPDYIELQVYTNCLLIVFSILDTMADTLSVRMCGHELRLSLEPVNDQEARKLAQEVQNDDRRQTMDSKVLNALVEETVRASQAASCLGIAVSYLPGYGSFLRALHRTLYSLILGVVDDVLRKTEIIILGERIRIQLVPEKRYQEHQLRPHDED